MIEKLRSNQFFKNNATFFIGSLAVAFINYAYYPIVGKLLSVESFGEVQVLVSFFIQLTVFLTVLGLVTTNVVVNEDDAKKSNKVVRELERAALYLAAVLFFVIVISSTFLQDILKFQSPVPFIAIAGVFMVSSILAMRGAFLRAKQDFLAASIQGIIASISKIIFSALLIIAGFSTSGAIAGLLIAQIISLVYATRRAKSLGYTKQKNSGGSIRHSVRLPDFTVIRPYYRYMLFVFGVSIITTFMYSLDVAVVKFFFSPEQAGQYASIATIARIIFFLTGSFAVVILSTVKKTATPSANYSILIRSFIITLVLGGSAALFFTLFPTFTVHLLFGDRYDSMVHLLPPLSIAMLFASLSAIVSNYHIALGHYLVLLWVSLGFAITVILILNNHSNVDQVVLSFLAGSFVIASLLIGWTGYRALPLLQKK